MIALVPRHPSWNELSLELDDLLTKLRFGVSADDFEGAFQELGLLLGFKCQRPDKEWKEGPDNLWCLADGRYLLVECKSDVSDLRTEISRHESGQMNNSIAWFEKNYPGCHSTNVMIVPFRRVERGAGFNRQVLITRKKKLKQLRDNVRGFFAEFNEVDPQQLSENAIRQALQTHSLTAANIETLYTEASLSQI